MEFNNKVIFSERYNVLFITVECCNKLGNNTMLTKTMY